MPSKLELSFRIRAFLLILFIVSAGVSIPTNEIRSYVVPHQQDPTSTFFHLVYDLLQRPNLLQVIFTHPEASINLLTYFQYTANANDSLFWLQNKASVFALLSDGDTYNIIGKHPWLFPLLRAVNQSYPALFGQMLQNRVNLNKLLNQTANHPSIVKLLTPNPEYISRLYNISAGLPDSGPWTRIIDPADGAYLTNTTKVVILTLTDTNITKIAVSLLLPTLAPIATLNVTANPFLNYTVDTAPLSQGLYYLSVNVKLSDGTTIGDTIRIYRFI